MKPKRSESVAIRIFFLLSVIAYMNDIHMMDVVFSVNQLIKPIGRDVL